MSADERRQTVVAAAITCFARGGLHGTTTDAIARRAGISQPYLFRLFPTKIDLFTTAIRRCFDRVADTFDAAAAGLRGEEALMAMGEAYRDLLGDRDLLGFQLQAYAAAGDPVVQAAAREGFGGLWRMVREHSGAGDERLREFFAFGGLLNTIVALDLVDIADATIRACLPDSFPAPHSPADPG